MVAGLAWLTTSCGLFGEDVQNDGQVCQVDDDCSTGVCTSASVCSHSACDCPSGNCIAGGEVTSDCLDGWVCVRYDSIFDPLKEFFGGTANPSDGYCQPTCEAGCPDHYVCGSDQLCAPDISWVLPVPTIAWTGAVTGELSGDEQTTTVMVEQGWTITVSGSAVSPTGAAIIASSWVTVSASGDYLEQDGPNIETTVPIGAGDYRRVEFTAIDDQARSGMITVIFESCMGVGEACGFEGSGCCNGCDGIGVTCL